MKVEYIAVEALTPYAFNNRKHSAQQIDRIANSIAEFGFNQPLVIDEDKIVLVGHARLEAAKKLGLEKVPVVKVGTLTEAQKKAYRILDNKLQNDSEWNFESLGLELSSLEEMDFDLEAWGLNELKELFPEEEPEVKEDDFEEGASLESEPFIKRGDLIELGRHRVLCGDSTSAEDVGYLIDNDPIQFVYTDPPYGISIVQNKAVGGSKPFGSKGERRGTVGASNIVKVNIYPEVAGDDSTDTAVEAYKIAAGLGARTMIFWGGNYYASALPDSSCWIVWDKENSGNFADAELAWTNQKTAVRIFSHKWNGMIKASERGEKRVHPTQKPVALAAWCFTEYGEKTDSVLDLFLGSGSTLIAAEQLGRTCYGMEIEPKYCQVIIDRYAKYCADRNKPFECKINGEPYFG